jgi:hypothetical protein
MGRADTFHVREPRLTAVPATRSRLPVLQLRLALVLGSLVLSAVMGIISTIAWIGNKPAPVDLRGAQAYGQAVAQIAAQSWLDGKSVTLPVLESVVIPPTGPGLPHGPVVWEGFTRESNSSGLVFERHTFLTTVNGVDENGDPTMTLLRVAVSVAFPGTSQAALAALPSLEPVDDRASDKVFDYSDLELDDLPNEVSPQLVEWAKAYAADDRANLKQLTGDSAGGVEYVGLGGFVAEEPNVIAALPAGDTSYGSDTWLLRARIPLQGANGFTSEIEMDLTVVEASSGLPRIVGWGPAGVGLRGPNETRRTN